MKKYILLAVIGALFLVSCQDNSPECKYHTTTLNLDVKQPDWKFDENAKQFYYHFDVPEITSYVYNYGNWSICREYFGNDAKSQADDYQVALPQSLYMVEEVVDTVTNTFTPVYYTQHLDYRLGIGYVDIQVTNSDYFYGQDNPEDMSFRLQLIY